MDLQKEARRTLQRLLPRLTPLLPPGDAGAAFCGRLEQHFPDAFRLLLELYGSRYDFFYHVEQIMRTTAQSYAERPGPLRDLDAARESDRSWFFRETMVGGIIYVDHFAGSLQGVRAKIPYFKELNLTYLHLMPLFLSPEVNNDGGYAISSYRDVAPALGTAEELAALAAELRAEGISLVLDFVFNHTSDEHEWARRALAGEEDYQDFYLMFPDRAVPDQYERTLREIFPEQAPGNFTYRPEIDRWVWTTFHNFQWDLNYANPRVFRAMLRELLFLANLGTEVMRLDAVAFAWKQMGTTCEGLPQVHTLVRAFNALVRIAAPAMVFKSEAIVHPAEVARYVDPHEAPISYNPTLMALLWESLATRKVTLLKHSMQRRFGLPDGCSWVNYIRCHDDIGWTFADEDAWEIGINGYDHRQFLNQFYTGRFPGSFARGLPFNFNPLNQDMRICGMAASLAGLEHAIETGNDRYREFALRRLELIHAVILSAGGIPLVYLGDEIAALNDYSFQQDSDRVDDNRWVHRPDFDWARAAQRRDPDSDAGRIFGTLQKLIAIRRRTPAFANGPTQFLETRSEHVLGYVRGGAILVLANFSEEEQSVRPGWLPADPLDLVTGEPILRGKPVTLAPLRFLWLAAGDTNEPSARNSIEEAIDGT